MATTKNNNDSMLFGSYRLSLIFKGMSTHLNREEKKIMQRMLVDLECIEEVYIIEDIFSLIISIVEDRIAKEILSYKRSYNRCLVEFGRMLHDREEALIYYLEVELSYTTNVNVAYEAVYNLVDYEYGSVGCILMSRLDTEDPVIHNLISFFEEKVVENLHCQEELRGIVFEVAQMDDEVVFDCDNCAMYSSSITAIVRQIQEMELSGDSSKLRAFLYHNQQVIRDHRDLVHGSVRNDYDYVLRWISFAREVVDNNFLDDCKEIYMSCDCDKCNLYRASIIEMYAIISRAVCEGINVRQEYVDLLEEIEALRLVRNLLHGNLVLYIDQIIIWVVDEPQALNDYVNFPVSLKLTPGLESKCDEYLQEMKTMVKDLQDTKVKVSLGLEDMFTSGFSSLQSIYNLLSAKNVALSIVVLITLILMRQRKNTHATILLCSAAGMYALTQFDSADFQKIIYEYMINERSQSAEEIVPILVELISVGMFSSHMNFKDMRSWGASLAEIDRNCKGLTNYLERCTTLTFKIIENIAHALGHDISLSTNVFKAEFDAIDTLLRRITKAYVENNSNVSVSIAADIVVLDSMLAEIQSKIPLNSTGMPLRSALNHYIHTLAPIKLVMKKAGLGYGGRIETAYLGYVGAPGTGKSHSSPYITRALTISQANRNELLDMMRDINSAIHDYVIGAKHMDGLKPTAKTTYVNDMFASTDAEGQPSEATFAINALGPNEFVTPQARANDKGELRYNCTLMVVNSNVMQIVSSMFKSIRNVTALLRRVENTYLVCVKKEFGKDHGKPVGFPVVTDHTGSAIKDQAQFYLRMDPSKLGLSDACNVDDMEDGDFEKSLGFEALRFIKFCPTTGRVDMRTEMGFFEHLETMLKWYDGHIKKHERNRQKVQRFTQNMFKARERQLNMIEKGEVPTFSILAEFAQNGDESVFSGESEYTDVADSDTVCSDASHTYRGFLEPGVFAYAPDSGHSKLRSPDGDFYSNVEQDRIINAAISSFKRDGNMMCEILDPVSDSYDGFRDFTAQYVRNCLISGERLSFEDYPGFKGDCLHPLHLLIDNCDLQELQEFLDWGLKDRFFVRLLQMRNKCIDTSHTLMVVAMASIDSIRSNFSLFLSNPAGWFLLHPVVGMVAVVGTTGALSFGLGYGLTMIMIGVFKISLSLLGDNAIEEMDEVKEVNLCVEQSSDLSSKDTENLLSKLRNVYTIYFRRKYKDSEVVTTCPGVLTMLGGHCGIMPGHFAIWKERIAQGSSVVSFEMGLLEFDQTDIKNCKWIDCRHVSFQSRWLKRSGFDIVEVRFPRTFMHQASNILRYLPSKKSGLFLKLKNLPHFDTHFIRKIGSVNKKVHVWEKHKMSFAGTIAYEVGSKTVDSYTGETIHGSNLTFGSKESFEIDCTTTRGECGQWAFLTDAVRLQFVKEDPVLENPTMLYYHTSGNVFSGKGHGMILWREDFEDMEKDILHKITDFKGRFEETLAFAEKCMIDSMEEEHAASDCLESHHRAVMELDPLPASSNSSIKRSKLYGIFDGVYPMTRAPARLFDEIKNGVVLRKMDMARKPYGGNFEPVVNLPLLRSIQINNGINRMNCSSEVVDTDLVTYNDAILGNRSYHMPMIDMNTSPGFTLKYLKNKLKISGKGKKWIFGPFFPDLETPMAKALKKIVDYTLQRLKNGDRVWTVFSDCLKDELLAFEKLAEGKCRLFCAGELVFLILVRMYFGTYTGWIYDNRIRNGIAIGINPCSEEWTTLYNYLMSPGGLGFFGDFSKFDKYQLASVMYGTLERAKLYYGDKDIEANKIRELLYEDMVSSYHSVTTESVRQLEKLLPKGEFVTLIYNWQHGNTSGNPLTAIINSDGNEDMSMYTIYAIVKGGEINDVTFDLNLFSHIKKNVRQISYGDDHCIGANPDVLNNLDFFSFQAGIKKYFNMVYTDELKGLGGEVPPWRKIIDGNFIARGFQPSPIEAGRMDAPLRLYSILESVQWDKKQADLSIHIQKVQGALQELGYRGESDFNYYAPILVKACYDQYGIYPAYASWDEAIRAIYNREDPVNGRWEKPFNCLA